MLATGLAGLLAQTDSAVPHLARVPWRPETFIEAIISTAVFGTLGLALLFLGYKFFDWLTPGLHIEKELAEKNVAVAVLVGAVLISLGYIIAHTITG